MPTPFRDARVGALSNHHGPGCFHISSEAALAKEVLEFLGTNTKTGSMGFTAKASVWIEIYTSYLL